MRSLEVGSCLPYDFAQYLFPLVRQRLVLRVAVVFLRERIAEYHLRLRHLERLHRPEQPVLELIPLEPPAELVVFPEQSRPALHDAGHQPHRTVPKAIHLVEYDAWPFASEDVVCSLSNHRFLFLLLCYSALTPQAPTPNFN